MRPNKYEKFVNAEIPDPTNPILHENVVKHIMHKPYGALKKKIHAYKMTNAKKKKKKRYPYPFCTKNVQGKDSYPIYCKRNGNHQVLVHSATLDYHWFMSYNLYLLTWYNCHLNVEICSNIKAIKYLYKFCNNPHSTV